MSELSVLIIEDEFAIALDLEMKLRALGFRVAGIASSWQEVNLLMEEELPDIVLSDINLGNKESGIDIAEKIFRDYGKPVVFLSAYSNHETIDAALKTKPFGYLVKPYRTEELNTTLRVAYSRWKEHQEEFSREAAEATFEKSDHVEEVFLKQGQKMIKIVLHDITYMQALDNYSMVYTSDQRYIVNTFLTDLLQNLNHPDFVRVHRSYAVNKKKISSIEESTVFIGETPVPVSRTYKKTFMQQIKTI